MMNLSLIEEKKMKNRLFAILISCFLFMLFGCSESAKNEKPEVKKINLMTSSCQLNMGWDPWEPYQYLTPDDSVRGLDIDLIKAIANEAGCNVNYIQKSWMDLLRDVKDGNIDLVAGASKNQSREEFAYFSDNYRHESFILYVRTGETQKYANKSLKELLDSNFRLGATDDYIYGDMVTALQDDPKYKSKFVYVPMTEVNYYNLLERKTDGFLEDPFVAAFTLKRKGLQEQIEAYPIEIHSGDVAIMFSKKSVKAETVTAFNQAIVRLKASGEYQNIMTKYRH
jgi:polar amino acid transport system substrate-binding protein